MTNIFGNVCLFTILMCCFSIVAGEKKTKVEQLATQVCRNTAHFNFCRQTVYSDDRAPTADRVVLAYIVFGNAYLNATNIRARIKQMIKGGDVSGGLRSCMAYYTDAIEDLSEVIGNLDSESYYDFDKHSTEAQGLARSCENGFDRSSSSPITKENVDFIKLTDICYAVAMLFKDTN